MSAFQRMVWGTMLCLAVVATGFGQITITAQDVGAQLVVGSTVTNRVDSVVTQLDIGAPGSNTLWDFSMLRRSSFMTLNSVTVSSTPFAASYSGATHALASAMTYAGIAGHAYMYLTLATNLTNMGIKAVADIDATTTLVDTYSPADVVYALPSTLGSSWTSTYSESVTFNLFGIPGTPSVTNHNYSYSVDAFGLMKMPDGISYDALRIRRMDSTAAGKKVGYMFLAKNGASVQLWLVNVNAPDHGVVSVQPVQWSAPFNTAVEAQQGNLPKEVRLLQNYPNPFNPSTEIRFELPAVNRVNLVVYDLLGREVATLVNEVRNPGSYSVTWNASGVASGIYLYRLQVGDGTVMTRKMTLLR
jgi:hypothetical protein